MKEWDYKKNTIDPNAIIPGARDEAYWICSKCGYSWKTRIIYRTRKGHGCPCCSGRVPKKGINDLKTLRPDIAKDWDYDNNPKGPKEYKVNSHAMIAWKCTDCGHKWENRIMNRTRNPGCPNCKKQVKIRKF